MQEATLEGMTRKLNEGEGVVSVCTQDPHANPQLHLHRLPLCLAREVAREVSVGTNVQNEFCKLGHGTWREYGGYKDETNAKYQHTTVPAHD